jgi:hypothetical protein
MKKTLLIISILLNLIFIGVFLISLFAKRLPDQQALRLQSAYKISNGLLNGKIKPEDVLTENKWYLLNKGYLDSYAVVYHFEYDDNSWNCAIGPMHPPYGPGVIFDSQGEIKIYKAQDFIKNHPYLKKEKTTEQEDQL